MVCIAAPRFRPQRGQCRSPRRIASPALARSASMRRLPVSAPLAWPWFTSSPAVRQSPEPGGGAGRGLRRSFGGGGQSCAVVPFVSNGTISAGGLRGRPMVCRAVVGPHGRRLARGRRFRPCARKLHQRQSLFFGCGFDGPTQGLFGILPELIRF
jgi:hypothetical protein